MSEKEKKTEGTEGQELKDIVIDEKEPVVKKVLKWTVKGLVLAVTFVGGLLLGKNLGGHDNSDESDNAENDAA